jgi:hypothetical protein
VFLGGMAIGNNVGKRLLALHEAMRSDDIIGNGEVLSKYLLDLRMASIQSQL